MFSYGKHKQASPPSTRSQASSLIDRSLTNLVARTRRRIPSVKIRLQQYFVVFLNNFADPPIKFTASKIESFTVMNSLQKPTDAILCRLHSKPKITMLNYVFVCFLKIFYDFYNALWSVNSFDRNPLKQSPRTFQSN